MTSGGYLLDTNVLSETRKKKPEPGVSTFLQHADADSLFVSALTLGELRKGVAVTRTTDPVTAAALEGWVDTMQSNFAERILPIDADVARVWGELSAGRSLPVIDTLIAATAITRDLTLVTRNVRDVQATGVATLNPWPHPA